MLRKFLLLLALLVIVGIVLVGTGIVHVDFWRGQVTINRPEVSTEKREVDVPTLRINTGNDAAPAPAAAPANSQ